VSTALGPDNLSDGAPASRAGEFANPLKAPEYTDGRLPGDWRSKYPPEARKCINQEAAILASALLLFTLLSGFFVGVADQSIAIPLNWLAFNLDPTVPVKPPILHVSFRLLAIYFVGGVGGVTFSIKWLVHSAAKCKWHLDRRYWRLFVPLIGGVYACVVLTLLDSGIIGSGSGEPRAVASSAALAFLVGYFSDGVSGLLSNVANAVFGTLEKK
jgi:hypothetical protein